MQPAGRIILTQGFEYDGGHTLVNVRQEGYWLPILYKPFQPNQLFKALTCPSPSEITPARRPEVVLENEPVKKGKSMQLLDKLSTFAKLEKGWNSYSAPSPTAAAIDNAKRADHNSSRLRYCSRASRTVGDGRGRRDFCFRRSRGSRRVI